MAVIGWLNLFQLFLINVLFPLFKNLLFMERAFHYIEVLGHPAYLAEMLDNVLLFFPYFFFPKAWV